MSDPKDLTTVFRGSMAEVLLIHGVLNSLEFRTFVADETTKTIYPFITGGNIFELSLEAPREEATQIAVALKELHAPRTEIPSGGSAGSNHSEVEDSLPAGLENLGRRLRWGLLALLLLAPWSPAGLVASIVYLCFGLAYGHRVKRYRLRPSAHLVTTGCVVLVSIYALTLVGLSLVELEVHLARFPWLP